MDNKEQKIAKPLGLLRRELGEKIANAINESGVPLSMCVYLVKDIVEQLDIAATKQENAEIAEYQAMLENTNKETELKNSDKD